MNEIESIFHLTPTYTQHTVVKFVNGSYACSCGVMDDVSLLPNLRE